MERLSSSKILRNALLVGASTLALALASGTLCASQRPYDIMPEQQTPSPISPRGANPLSLPQSSLPSAEYQSNKPQPLMHGEGFNYDLYYNYRLTPHIILRPNLQQTTKPGAVEDNSQRFVGGLSAGIKF
ncbi:carbohydrate porin [Erwinia sp. SLM-02]|uniref:carbohydrate porin n=1 Tax=Erwinia sp. SLM-02 TaxID=3020057 RepID=UPI0028D343CD|nr:carbohydrate porin [uncultured Erwinia sp.]